MKLEEFLETLPNPETDQMPPRVEWTEEGLRQWQEDRAEKAQYLSIKNDTEERVKYVLENKFGARIRKDGDWITRVGGRDIWQKKVADFVGRVPYRDYNAYLYIEVKGISPGQSFPISRLTKRNNPKQPSQHEKLMEAHNSGDLVWLALGFWDARHGAEPVIDDSGKRKYKRWKKEDVELTVYTIPWEIWILDVLPAIEPRKSFRQQDREMIKTVGVYKVNNRWQLHPHHWYYSFSS